MLVSQSGVRIVVISFTTETGSDNAHSGTRQIFFRRCGKECQVTSVFAGVTKGKVGERRAASFGAPLSTPRSIFCSQ